MDNFTQRSPTKIFQIGLGFDFLVLCDVYHYTLTVNLFQAPTGLFDVGCPVSLFYISSKRDHHVHQFETIVIHFDKFFLGQIHSSFALMETSDYFSQGSN